MKPVSPTQRAARARRLLSALILAAAAALLGTACVETGAYAARINGKEISTSEFLRELEALRQNPAIAEVLGLSTEPEGTVNTDLTTAWLTRLVQDTLVAQEAARRDVTPTAEQRQEAQAQAVQQFNGEEAWGGFPEWFQKRIVDRVALVLALETAVAGRPTEREVRAEFERTRDELGELACASHILVESRETAEEIRNQLGPDRPFSQMRDDFEQVARAASSDSGSGQRGGDLGCQPRNSYVKPFEDYVWSGEVGRLSPPVQSEFGFHLVVVRSRGAARFEDVRDDIASRLAEQSAQEFTAVMTAVVEDSDIDVNPKFGTFDPASLTGRFVVGPESPSPPDGPPGDEEGGEGAVTLDPGTGPAPPGQAPPAQGQ